LRLLALALGAVLAAGCGGEEDEATAEPETSLEIAVTGGGEHERWTLTCEPAGGTHPDPEAACDALAEQQEALAPTPMDVACTEIYGGPQVAEVSGRIDGETYRGVFKRTNGCEIGRWERLQPLLVVHGGV
jgi:hypothetical protein